MLLSCMELRIPGSFVVMHGLSGDGMMNTIDRLPHYEVDSDDDNDNDEDNQDDNDNEMKNDNTNDTTETHDEKCSSKGSKGSKGGDDYFLVDDDDDDVKQLLSSAVSAAAIAAAVESTISISASSVPPTIQQQKQQQLYCSPSSQQVEVEQLLAGIRNTDDTSQIQQSTSSDHVETGAASAAGAATTVSPSPAVLNTQQQASSLPILATSNLLLNQPITQNQRPKKFKNLKERAAIALWHDSCRHHERQQRQEWRESNVPASSSAAAAGSSGSFHDELLWWATTTTTTDSLLPSILRLNWNDDPSTNTTSKGTAPTTPTADSDTAQQQQQHVQQPHQLALFDSLPEPILGSKRFPKPVGALQPGTTVIATKLITLDVHSLDWVNVQPKSVPAASAATGSSILTSVRYSNNDLVYPPAREGWLQILQIELPTVSQLETVASSTSIPSSTSISKQKQELKYVVLSLDGYYFLGPGLPHAYVDPSVSLWRVTCPAGAYIREGLDLSTNHIATVPFGTLIRVHKKVVSAMGLSRLLITAFCTKQSLNATTLLQHQQQQKSFAAGGGAGSTFNNNNNPEFLIPIEGWCSEFLNPLSGQRGLIVQPVAFPVPARYTVVLPDGAVIRSGVELSSPQIGLAPFGCQVILTGRAFTEWPTEQCVERFRLAGNGGWISCRLNKAPPDDKMLVELLETDHSFFSLPSSSSSLSHEEDAAGWFHIQAMKRVYREQRLRQNNNFSTEEEFRTIVTAASTTPTTTTTTATSALAAFTTAAVAFSENVAENAIIPTCQYNVSAFVSSPSAASSSRKGGGGCFDPVGAAMSSASSLLSQTMTTTTTQNQHNQQHNHQQQQHNAKCLVCLCEDRTATLVHGETGHIVCCLICARILKAKNDPCPVCRLPIDLVIQHFWA